MFMCAPLATAWDGLNSWHTVFATNLFGVVNVQTVFVPVRFLFFLLVFSSLCRLFVFRFIRFGPVMVVANPAFI
jgi:hypothetical protein